MTTRRCAFTLIELTVVLTVLSLVGLSVTFVIYTLYRADHHLRENLQSEHALDRFAMQLRSDAHAAVSANLRGLPDGGDQLVLATVDERTIHYAAAEHGVQRVVRRGESVLHRDTFLVGRSEAVWELAPPEDASLINLILTTSGGRPSPPRVRQVKAAVATTYGTAVDSQEAS